MLRLATYNVEWFTELFDDSGRMLRDRKWSARQDVTRGEQLDALKTVFRALDADAVMVIEAPDAKRAERATDALDGFADWAGLRARRAVMGFANETRQEIALLYDPDRLSARHDPLGPMTGKAGRPDAPRFDGVFRIDLDIDATEDLVRFSKPPLELAVETADGFAFRMIGVHLKSKAPYGAQTRDDAMRLAIANRRKQLAQAIWLRARIDEHLAAEEPVVVLGDLNDGPGLDEYENLFGRSSVELVLGSGPDALYDPHAIQMTTSRPGVAVASSSRFWIEPEQRFLQAMLDYIMVSPDLAERAVRWRIWHPLDDPSCWRDAELREALVTASDHFPVTLDIDL